MSNIEKVAGQVVIVAAGVILAGVIMTLFPKMPLISKAANAYD